MDSTNSTTFNNEIRKKLSLYGINFEDYKNKTGNLVGVTKPPNIFLTLNPKISVEDTFYLVANKVFIVCNLIAKDIPRQFVQNWKKIVGDKIYADFKYAVYEEINQRFLSNNFPEFANSTIYTPSNMNIQILGNSGGGGVNPIDFLNPVSREILNNIDWFSIDPNLQLNDSDNSTILYSDLHNLDLGVLGESKVLGANSDGNSILFNYDDFVKQDSLNTTNEIISTNSTNLATLTSEFNSVKNTWQTENLATQEWVYKQITALPDVEIWNSNQTYNIPQFVIHDGGIWYCLQNNCLNKVPGGTDPGWWASITNIVQQSKDGEIIYKSGTDIKYSYANPSENWYVDLENIKNYSDVDDLFQRLNNLFPKLNLNIEQVNNFVNNFCGNISNLKSYCATLLNNSYTVKGGSIKIPIASSNEIRLFSTENSAKTWKNDNGVSGNDLDRGLYLRTGNAYPNATGGSNLITANNLPDYNMKINTYQNDNFTPVIMRDFRLINGYTGQWGGILDTGGNGKIRMSQFFYIAPEGQWNNIYGWSPYASAENSPIRDGVNGIFYDWNTYFFARLNDTGTQTEFLPKYRNVCAVITNSTTKTIKLDSSTIQIRPSTFKCFVNVVDIQSYWRGSDILLDVSRMLEKYYLKVDVDSKLATKINTLEKTNDNHVVLANDSGNLKATNFTNVDLDKLNKIDEKLDINPDNWDSDMCNNIVNKLKQYWSHS